MNYKKMSLNMKLVRALNVENILKLILDSDNRHPNSNSKRNSEFKSKKNNLRFKSKLKSKP